MPDIWTHHPEIVRDLLREAGFTWGAEPRILEGRDLHRRWQQDRRRHLHSPGRHDCECWYGGVGVRSPRRSAARRCLRSIWDSDRHSVCARYAGLLNPGRSPDS